MATDEQIIEFLKTPQRIAIVGMSQYEDRASHFVPKFLAEQGHIFIPVHPMLSVIAGEKVYKTLDLVEPIPDAVIIYISMRNVDKIVSQAIDLGIKLIWLPLDITSTLRSKAEEKGIIFIEDKCPKIEWKNLISDH